MIDPFPELTSQRFRLRRIDRTDRESVFRALSDPEVTVCYGVHFDSLEAIDMQFAWWEQILQEESGIWWGICRQRDPRPLLGACGINHWVHEHRRAELGFWLLPEHWRQGIMRECAAAVVRYAFERLKLHRLEAEVEPENEASCRLLDRLGFRLEGVRRECEIKGDRFIDVRNYARLATDPHPPE